MNYADSAQAPIQPAPAERGSDARTARIALEEAWRKLAPVVDEARSLEERASQNPSQLSDPWVAAHTRWLQVFDREIKAVEAVHDAASTGGKLSLEGIRTARYTAEKLLGFITQARERLSRPRADIVGRALLELQGPVNETRRRRSEVELDLLALDRKIDDATRGDVERLATALNLNAAAVAATLGVSFRNAGKGDEAQPLLEAAADGGDAMAANTLGLVLEEQHKRDGEQYKRDAARRRFRESAEKGDDQGKYNFGRMLWEDGEHVEAEKWLEASKDPLAAEFLSRVRAERPQDGS